MKQLKVAVSAGLEDVFESIHEQVPVKGADWMEVSAVVLSSEDLRAGKLEEVQSLTWEFRFLPFPMTHLNCRSDNLWRDGYQSDQQSFLWAVKSITRLKV